MNFLTLFLRSLLTTALVFSLVACNNDDDESSSEAKTSNISGLTVGLPAFQALQARKSNKNANEICQGIRNEYAQDNYEDLTIFRLSDKKVFECDFGNNWKNQCKELGTYSGNKVSLKIQGQPAAIVFRRMNKSTLKVTKMSVNGKAVDLKKAFAKDSDRIIKYVSEADIDTFNSLFKDCGLL